MRMKKSRCCDFLHSWAWPSGYCWTWSCRICSAGLGPRVTAGLGPAGSVVHHQKLDHPNCAESFNGQPWPQALYFQLAAGSITKSSFGWCTSIAVEVHQQKLDSPIELFSSVHNHCISSFRIQDQSQNQDFGGAPVL